MLPMNFDRCATVDDFVEYGKKLDYKHDALYIKKKISTTDGDNVIVNYDYLLDKYMYDILANYIEEYEMEYSEFIRYKYNPKAFCFNLYLTTELWSALLRINNMTSVMDFTKRTINIFSEEIFEVIEEILNLEKKALQKNQLEISK